MLWRRLKICEVISARCKQRSSKLYTKKLITEAIIVWQSDQTICENSIIITFSKNYKLNYRVSILFTSACKYLKHWSNCSMENESCLCLHSISKYLNLPWADNGGARIEETSILSFSSSQFPATRIWQNNNTPREKKKGNKLRTGQEEADIEKHHCLDFKNRRGNLT